MERRHHWVGIREMPTCIEAVPLGSRGGHESVLRAWHVLREVDRMLERGDSPETWGTAVRVVAVVVEGEDGSEAYVFDDPDSVYRPVTKTEPNY